MMKEFRKSIGGLKGAEVRFFFNDNQYIEGTLLEVKEDHLVVDVNEKVFYIALKQVYGISQDVKDNRVLKQIPPFIDKKHLTDVLNTMKYNIVTINGMYNKLLEGLLISISEDCIMLVNHDEIHLVSYSSIFNVCNGIYEQKAKQDDDLQQIKTRRKQNTELLIETPAILIHLNFDPLQDKIAESSFLEKNQNSGKLELDDEKVLEKKAANLSITENILFESDGNSPTSSLIESMEQTELDQPLEQVVLESKESNLSDINEVVTSPGEEKLGQIFVDEDLQLLSKVIEQEIVEEAITVSNPYSELKEDIEDHLVQEHNEEIYEQKDAQLFNNEIIQPLSHNDDEIVAAESTNLEQIDEEVISEEIDPLDEKTNNNKVNQEDLKVDEFEVTVNSDFEMNETINSELIQLDNNEEVANQPKELLSSVENHHSQPGNVDDGMVIESSSSKTVIDEEILEDEVHILDEQSFVVYEQQKVWLDNESLNFQSNINENVLSEEQKKVDSTEKKLMKMDSEDSINPENNERVTKSATYMARKFYLIEPLSKHKLKQIPANESESLETESQSNCSMKDKADQKNLLEVPCYTRSLEKTESLQVKSTYQSSINEQLILEEQYLSLMKHAERMLKKMDSSENCEVIIRNQYLSLYKSAKKMYNQLKEQRIKKVVEM
ncbi:MAG TPA: DUF2642 domain-containing protein [Ureibacillus sp.]|nr:DUF2642 domain-containing protein [Ureibacillus sp.]